MAFLLRSPASIISPCRTMTRRFSSAVSNVVVTTQEDNTSYAVVKMNRPPVNSLNVELIQELDSTIKTLEKDPNCRGIILASTNPKIFSAGLDILEMYQPKPDRLKTFWTSLQELYLTLNSTKMVTVAAIEGHSPAGGCLLAMCCDYRVMATGKPLIGLNETKLGIVAPSWFQNIMVNTIGHRESEKMLGLGMQVNAEKAVAIKLVDEAVTPDQVMYRSTEMMKEWLKIPDAARVTTKKMLRKDIIDHMNSVREADLKLFEGMVFAERTQKSLEKYLQSLRK